MEILSHREKKIKQAVDVMFAGLDDDVLKTVVYCTSMNMSEEEKDRICEQIRKKKEDDEQYFREKFEIVVDANTGQEVLRLINPEPTIEITDVTEKCEHNIEEENHGEN